MKKSPESPFSVDPGPGLLTGLKVHIAVKRVIHVFVNYIIIKEAQWLSGRVLVLRSRGH